MTKEQIIGALKAAAKDTRPLATPAKQREQAYPAPRSSPNRRR